MRAVLAILVGSIVALGARPAGAQDRVELDASLGYALPLGSIERGSRLGDTTYGGIPIDLRAALRVAPRVGLLASVAYAPAIPKLCASVDDCMASFGRDVAIAVGVRFSLPPFWRIAARVDLGVGYAWYASTLSDNGTSSTRSASGPTFLDVRLSAPITLGRHFALGPFLGARIGSFLAGRVETPLRTIEGLDGIEVHAWLRVGVDAAFTF